MNDQEINLNSSNRRAHTFRKPLLKTSECYGENVVPFSQKFHSAEYITVWEGSVELPAPLARRRSPALQTGFWRSLTLRSRQA